MGALDALAVGAAEHIERSFGPFAGLRAFAALLPRGPLSGDDDTALGARATLGALRCATEARDKAALETAARAWAFCGGARRSGESAALVALVARLEREGARDVALLLARSESTRAPSARAWYLLGRTAEGVERAEVALFAYREAVKSDEDHPAVQAARRRLAALLTAQLRPEDRVELAALVGESPDPGAEAGSDARLLFATLGLSAQSKFARAAALSTLEELARAALDAEPAVRANARTAIRAAAAHADARGWRLTALEADRVGACLKHWPAKEARERSVSLLLGLVRLGATKGAERERALVELAARDPLSSPAAEQAQALLAGALFIAEGVVGPHAVGLRAIAALDRGRPELAAETLASARGTPASPALWTATLLALAHAEVAEVALSVARELCASEGVPPRGWVSLAAALAASPSTRAREFATEVLERAGAAGEASVSAAVQARWTRRAWALASAGGKRAEALALLQRAARQVR